MANQIEQFLVELDSTATQSRLPRDVRDRMRDLLSQAAAAMEAGESDVVRMSLRRAAHDIGDVWPFDVALGAEILAYQQMRETRSDW